MSRPLGRISPRLPYCEPALLREPIGATPREPRHGSGRCCYKFQPDTTKMGYRDHGGYHPRRASSIRETYSRGHWSRHFMGSCHGLGLLDLLPSTDTRGRHLQVVPSRDGRYRDGPRCWATAAAMCRPTWVCRVTSVRRTLPSK